MTPGYVQWTVPSLIYQTRRKNPLVHIGLMAIAMKMVFKFLDDLYLEEEFQNAMHKLKIYMNKDYQN